MGIRPAQGRYAGSRLLISKDKNSLGKLFGCIVDEMIATLVLLFALFWGNFLNLCISYFPETENKAFFENYYSKYGAKKAWYWNIPIFTYFYLRKQNQKLPPKYIFIEILTPPLLLAFAYAAGTENLILWPFLLFFSSALLASTFIDLGHWIIPNKITLPGIPIGFIYSFLQEDISYLSSLGGILIGGGSLYLIGTIYLKWKDIEGVGGGDVKFLAMGGAFLGASSTILALAISSIFGSLIGAILMLISGKSPSKIAIPFGPCLALGMLLSFFWGEVIWEWYTHMPRIYE